MTNNFPTLFPGRRSIRRGQTPVVPSTLDRAERGPASSSSERSARQDRVVERGAGRRPAEKGRSPHGARFDACRRRRSHPILVSCSSAEAKPFAASSFCFQCSLGARATLDAIKIT